MKALTQKELETLEALMNIIDIELSLELEERDDIGYSFYIVNKNRRVGFSDFKKASGFLAGMFEYQELIKPKTQE